MTAGNHESKEKYEKSSEWKNWLSFINNTHKRLDELEEVGARAYFDKEYLNLFYAKLRLFISNRVKYFEDYEKVKENLDNIGDNLFSEKYMVDIKRKTNLFEVKRFQFRAMKALNKILEDVSENFSDYEMIPKVKKRKIHRQNKMMDGVSM